MKLLVGLGNPGDRYAETRHNVGFRIAERFARRAGVDTSANRFGGRFGAGMLDSSLLPSEVAPASPGARRGEAAPAGDSPDPSESTRVGILLPQTFMNRSGDAVAAALEALPELDPSEDLLVAFDDVDLPFGRLRLRTSGSAGGQRGLGHILDRVGTRDVPRLRFGVGRPAFGGDTRDYVLSPFEAEEVTALPGHLDRATDAVVAAFLLGVPKAMNHFNRDPEPASD